MNDPQSEQELGLFGRFAREFKTSPVSTTAAILAVLGMIVSLFIWAFSRHVEAGTALLLSVLALISVPLSQFLFTPKCLGLFGSLHLRFTLTILIAGIGGGFASLLSSVQETHRLATFLNEQANLELKSYLDSMPPTWLFSVAIVLSLTAAVCHAFIFLRTMNLAIGHRSSEWSEEQR